MTGTDKKAADHKLYVGARPRAGPDSRLFTCQEEILGAEFTLSIPNIYREPIIERRINDDKKVFDEDDVLKTQKAIQAVGVLGRAFGTRRMNYMRVLKLLYIADRESIRDTGHPMTGDALAAMDRGPVLSGVLNLIGGQHLEVPSWQAYIHTDGYHIRIHTEPGVSELSQYEIVKLQEIATRHRLDDEWAMVHITHQFQEWIRNHIDGTSRPIPLSDILDAVHRQSEKGAIIQEAQTEAAFDRIFGV